MKIIIEHSKTKREIVGPFNICGSADDLRNIAEKILSSIEGRNSMGYGWVSIHERGQRGMPETAPTSWD